MLTARQRLLASVLEAFGDADLRRFDDRLLLQKRIYLLRAAGVDLGHSYSWYLRGPYSPPLTRDAFALDGERRATGQVQPIALPKVIRDIVVDLRQALGAYWTDPQQLELLASVVFLSKTGNTDVQGRLKELKPKYTLREISKAIDFARARGWVS